MKVLTILLKTIFMVSAFCVLAFLAQAKEPKSFDEAKAKINKDIDTHLANIKKGRKELEQHKKNMDETEAKLNDMKDCVKKANKPKELRECHQKIMAKN